MVNFIEILLKILNNFFINIFHSIYLIFLASTFETIISLGVNCRYDLSDFWSFDESYRCYVLSIDTPENAVITNLTGTHMTNKANHHEIFFHCATENLLFFPIGLEKIYKNLIGFHIINCEITEIKQSDLKMYTKLKYLAIRGNKIEYLEDDIFKYNVNLEVIDFENNDIIRIGLQVFKHLKYLRSLDLSGNPFNKIMAENNSIEVQKIIIKVKFNFYNSIFLCFF